MSSSTHSAFAYLVGILLLGLSATGCRTSPAQEVKKGNEFFEKGKYQDAELHYRKAIQKDTNSGEAHYRLGLVDLRLGHGPKAYADLNRAVQLSPGNQDAKKELAELCLASYLRNPRRSAKMYEQVRTLSAQMLSADPKSAEAFRMQGYLALTENKAEEAVDRFATQTRPLPLTLRLPAAWPRRSSAPGMRPRASKWPRMSSVTTALTHRPTTCC